MNRKMRTEILIKGSSKVANKLAQEILDKYEVQVIEKPNNGLVMAQMRETAQKSLFYLGEVFITECKVMINECLGMGIVKGQETELAYNLAVIDAAYGADLPETKTWTKILLQEEEQIKQSYENFKQKVLKTKVNFQTMDV